MRTSLLTFCLCLVLVGVAQADSLHFRQVGQWGSAQLVGVAVKETYAYVVGLSGSVEGLHVLSLDDIAHPVEVWRCSAMATSRDVAVSGEYLYYADDNAGLRIFSISDPENPLEIARWSKHSAWTVKVSGSNAYVLDYRGLSIITVADPTHPREVGRINGPGYPQWEYVAVDGDYAYVTARSGGLHIISVADPTHPVEVGYYTPGVVTGVAVRDSYAYVGCAGSFRVVSVADPSSPVEVGILDSTAFAGWGMVSIRGYVLAAAGINSGLWAISVRDPTHPALAGYYGGKCGWYSLLTDGDYVYYAELGLRIFQFYQLGDLDIDNDSLDVAADTLRLQEWTTVPSLSFRRSDEVAIGGISAERPLDSAASASLGVTAGAPFECVRGEFILANTGAFYNPDPIDGPSISPVESLGVTGSLAGPGGTIDSIVIPNLPFSLAPGQTMVCTLAAYLPVGLKVGDYAGSIYISGTDTAGLQVYESCYVLVSKLGDVDVDDDSLDVVADTIRLSNLGSEVIGAFILANTSASYNPDTADGPSLSRASSLSFTASLTGPGGTLDSIIIQNFPSSLAQGQSAVCTLAVYLPDRLPVGNYSGPIVITGLDSVYYEVAETVYALVQKGVPGDLDVDNDNLDVTRDTINLHTQPAGPVYSPYAKARFMLVNTSSPYNPDTADGPSQSKLGQVKAEAKVQAQGKTLDSVYVLNLPESLAVGQSVECTLALVVPVGTTPDGYAGWVTISAYDTLGYQVRDSFFLTVRGPEPRQNLDSLRVAPIPFKPNQNPEHDAIHFQGLTAGARVTVYDASGESVWSATEDGDGHLKWKAEVASGIYVYLVVPQDGKSHVKGKLSIIR